MLKHNWCLFSFIPLPSALLIYLPLAPLVVFSPPLNVLQAKCWFGLKCRLYFVPLIVLGFFSFTHFHLCDLKFFCFGQFFFSSFLCLSGPLVLVNVGHLQTDCQSVPRLTVWTGQVCFSVQQTKFSSRVIFRFSLKAMCLLSHHSAVCSSPLISFFSKLAKTFQPIRITADFVTHIKLVTMSKFPLKISCCYLLVALLSCLSAHWPDWLSGR